MQSNQTLTPALSLSERERVKLSPSLVESRCSDRSATREFFSLSPSDGERVGVRVYGYSERLEGSGLTQSLSEPVQRPEFLAEKYFRPQYSQRLS